MSEKQREIYNAIIDLPEDTWQQVLLYIEQVKYNSAKNDAPEDLIIKDEDDLVNKLNEGMKDTKGMSLEEAVSRLDKIFAKWGGASLEEYEVRISTAAYLDIERI